MINKETFYTEDKIERMLINGELTSGEAGFMRGYIKKRRIPMAYE